MPFREHVLSAAGFLLKQAHKQPKHAILLGTGLKDIVNEFNILTRIPLNEIPYFPQMTVTHMDTSLYLATYQDIPVWILGGRIHYYEGYPMSEVTFPIRMLAEAGTQFFFLTNAAGNVNPNFSAGDLVLIDDHINWSFPSPLIGENIKEWGSRYPEMIDIYSKATNQNLVKFASSSQIQLNTGIYLGLTGPQLETPAEYQLFHRLGADMVGMSTVPEVIIAAHMNRRITALSVLSNDAALTPKKGESDINEILAHIYKRKKDVQLLAQHWLTL